MPCFDLFEEQSPEYQNSVLQPGTAKVAIEARTPPRYSIEPDELRAVFQARNDAGVGRSRLKPHAAARRPTAACAGVLSGFLGTVGDD